MEKEGGGKSLRTIINKGIANKILPKTKPTHHFK